MAKADEPFLARWSRRKSEARESAEPSTEQQPASEERETALLDEKSADEAQQGAPRPKGSGKGVLNRVLTEADFTDVDFGALDFKSDYSRFMQPGVPDEIRNKALRQLWVSDPIMANMDGLHDYWDDYTDAAVAVPKGTLKTAYRVGRGFLSDEEIAKWEALGRPEPAEMADPRGEGTSTEENVADTAPTGEAAEQLTHEQAGPDASPDRDAAAAEPSEHTKELARTPLPRRTEDS